jgi:hypothetical protein
MLGQEHRKKQPNAKEHVEIFLRFEIIRVFLFSSFDTGAGATLFSFDLAITNIL